ncbi:hypothetical protein GLOTRDRAFT_116453 [Gloeophyllum trabeum ATCC 11539]|uniref:Probable 26S proteasome regulatory subunit p27 n=1 Tax=Gloeophyllum trabeum (strain ATCC 11539 / FP-39264 / Madison 617) TaxID=670483 RepID=S7RP70_GLOTA|nr:uncharacterized protein GLOTRDRAFT_116453 [Gloeophyllum trabeum ATCC 11539]EPQ54604.1 hypothetical protein GLOTRDRAFT_116453 [Gloeophyllum trabeum ATCC 11539]
MGMTFPPPHTPAEQVRTLMGQKENLESELDAQFSILSANSSTMNSPLLDPEGFPRSDIDVWAVRHARVRIIELRNDMTALMDRIARALEGVYDPNIVNGTPTSASSAAQQASLSPFARVDGVAPGSPAATAGLQREDLILKFGSLTGLTSLQPLAELVSLNENRTIKVLILREAEQLTLDFTPRKGWGGRGMLGCHIVPYSVSQ